MTNNYRPLPDTPEAAIWPCYIGDHGACVGKSRDGECPCECHALEQCAFCKEWYPKPIELHHSDDECDLNVNERSADAGEQIASRIT